MNSKQVKFYMEAIYNTLDKVNSTIEVGNDQFVIENKEYNICVHAEDLNATWAKFIAALKSSLVKEPDSPKLQRYLREVSEIIPIVPKAPSEETTCLMLHYPC